MKPVLLLAAAASLVFFASPGARADVVSKQLKVTAEIVPFCAITTFDLAFGVYGTANISGGQDLLAQTSIGVICPDAIPYTVALDGGLSEQPTGPGDITICDVGGPNPSRAMKSDNVVGGNLYYDLYSDSARTAVWGCSPSTVQAGVGNGSTPDIFPLYGRILAGNVTLADTYSDSVTVTVTF